jgi:hypothetical protein
MPVPVVTEREARKVKYMSVGERREYNLMKQRERGAMQGRQKATLTRMKDGIRKANKSQETNTTAPTTTSSNKASGQPASSPRASRYRTLNKAKQAVPSSLRSYANTVKDVID